MSRIERVTETALCEHGKESITAIIVVRFPNATIKHVLAFIHELEYKLWFLELMA